MSLEQSIKNIQESLETVKELADTVSDFGEVIDETVVKVDSALDKVDSIDDKQQQHEKKLDTKIERTNKRQDIVEKKVEVIGEIVDDFQSSLDTTNERVTSLESIEVYNDQPIQEKLQEQKTQLKQATLDIKKLDKQKADKQHKHVIDDIEGLPALLEDIKNKPVGPVSVGGYTKGVRGIVAGTNVTIDNTDPRFPVINSTGGGGGGGAVDSVNGETGVVVLNQDDVLDGTTYKQYSATEKTKLAGIEFGAEVNNISDANATDLTDGGDTTLHTHDGRYYTETEVDTLLLGKLNTSLKGANNGVAELDAGGKVPSSQLPSFVDDVVVVANFVALPGTGETGKIYVTEDTNITYRWNGSGYTEISASLALGETSSTAYRGDRGKIAYDHSQLTSGNPHNVTKTDVGLSNVVNADTTTTANITDSTNKRFVTDTQLTVIGNTSGTNTGDVTLAGTPNYLTIVGQVITRALIDLTSHITGKLPFANLANGTAHSVVGRAGSGSGDVGNISAGNDTILGRNGTGNVAFQSTTTIKTMLAINNVDNTSDLNKPISTATQTALDSKQPDIQFKDEGTNAGTAGGVTIVDFVGAGVTASETAGTLTVTIPGGSGGGITWNEVTGTSQTAAVNNGYITNNAGLVTVTLPTTASVGATVRIGGKGAGLWRVAQNSGQIIHFGVIDSTSGTGGALQATERYDAVELVCITANTDWLVVSSLGNIDVI